MLVQPVEIDCRFIYPIPNVPMECQPELTLLCQLVYGEARGEPIEGWKAVAQVAINRYSLQKSYFGTTLRQVILDRIESGFYEFSCMNPSDVNYKRLMKPEELRWFQIVRAIVPMGSLCIPETKHFNLYYHPNTIGIPKFFQSLKYTETIGKHRFYTE